MIDKVLKNIKCHDMLNSGDRVVIALSGGADSMALAFFLSSIKKDFNLKLIAAHVNHCLRGAESDRDEAFVKKWCNENDIECRVLKKNVAMEANLRKIGLEECGREVRYDFFASFGRECKIATAHTMSDCTETVLFNLCRGASINGLCGIPPVNGSVIRPLITCTRAEIEKYCSENSIPYIVDSTNLKGDYSRNIIRNEIIPVFKKINSSFESSVSRFIKLANDDSDFINTAALELYNQCRDSEGLKKEPLQNAPYSLRSRAVNLYFEDTASLSADYNHIFAAQSVIFNGGRVQFPHGYFFSSLKEHVYFHRDENNDEPFNKKITDEKTVNCKEFFNNRKTFENAFDFFADYDKIKGNIEVTQRRSGDEITLADRGCTKTLKKYFNELGILPEKREQLPVIRDELGVIGVAHYGTAQRVAIGSETLNVYMIKLGG